ncbi:class I SAM-dependent methyltransferase [Desulfospira joergensenii]|uniref:class I SAM-dependent methyltransferase n=1 Tax=Desulfospira joergensenii TaxID=53329 RepID=UPI0003B4B5BD|nr:class I SAM-dependent methyltransferase [Desulfospira joergensenii]
MGIEAGMIEGVNWEELWKKALLAASWRKRETDPVRFFDKKANWYNRTVLKRTDTIDQMLSRLAIDHGCSVLDIGSGPGTLAIPLARTAGKITAVEPSGEMLNHLHENAGKAGINNITTINKRWEDVVIGKDIKPHDVVIASHSLAMADIKEALFKIDQAATQRVCIFDFAGKPQWDYLDLWPKLYGEVFVHGPNYIFIVNILYQMGITANVEVWEHHGPKQIQSLEDAVRERVEYFDSPLPSAKAVIREYLKKNLVTEDDKVMTRRTSKTAMISWKKSTGDREL